MKVLVRLEGFLATQFWREKEIDVPKGTTWGELVQRLFEMLGLGRYSPGAGEPISLREYAIFVLNGRESPPDVMLEEGDKVSVLSLLPGG